MDLSTTALAEAEKQHKWEAMSATDNTLKLTEHANKLLTVHLSELFEKDAARFEKFSRRVGPLLIDFSKQRVDETALQLLSDAADAADLGGWIKQLFAGDKINSTEGRAAMHWLLRSPSTEDAKSVELKGVHQQLQKMETLVAKIHAGQWRGFAGDTITDIVNIGVGGSDLGPLMCCRALEDTAPESAKGLNIHYVSTMDGSQVSHLLRQLAPQTTLFIISSKSFSTVDTLYNANTARAWLERAFGDDPALIRCHFLGVSSKADAMLEWGIPEENQLALWDWVGGRFSVWSAIGLPVALKIGMDNFRQMLEGAHRLDQHFESAPWTENIPVLMALIGVWNTNYLHIGAQAILPYDGRLKYLPSYLSQLEMESNGKSVRRDGEPVEGQTCPVVWGDVGPNAQHAFYQLLHQGTQAVTCDFIAPASRYQEAVHGEAAVELVYQHELALANCLAQSRLLALGEAALPAGEQLPGYKRYRGNQPSSTLLLDTLTPFSLGMLMAAYEHKVFTQAVIWGINPFDQWGVEMGKKIATETLAHIRGEATGSVSDSSTNGLVALIRSGLNEQQ